MNKNDIYKLGGIHRPKGGDDDDNSDYDDDLTRSNTHANAAGGGSNSKLVVDAELEEESDATSHTGTETDTNSETTDSVSTGMDDDDNTDLEAETDDETIETPAMLAKKVATAASTIANSDAKKKATIASKRAIASSKPPKGKATLQDITTLQNSYDDIAHAEEGYIDDDDNEDDTSDDGNNYLRKFETEMHDNYVASHHQEMIHLNNQEVSALARVVRNVDGAIVDAMHKTMPFLTKYEKTRILGQRAKQLNQGAQPMVPVDQKIIDGYLIAQLELQQKALPFIIRRPLPGGKSEYWRVSDLEII
jgi:DNA-directed RNA polymerase I, II, and III subunit RPABC2